MIPTFHRSNKVKIFFQLVRYEIIRHLALLWTYCAWAKPLLTQSCQRYSNLTSFHLNRCLSLLLRTLLTQVSVAIGVCKTCQKHYNRKRLQGFTVKRQIKPRVMWQCVSSLCQVFAQKTCAALDSPRPSWSQLSVITSYRRAHSAKTTSSYLRLPRCLSPTLRRTGNSWDTRTRC